MGLSDQGAQPNSKGRWLLFIGGLLLGSIFVASGIAKLSNQADFASVVASYGILPTGLAELYGSMLPWAELAIGSMLILGLFSRIAAGIGVALVVSFIVANAYTILHGNGGCGDNYCGCFGEALPMNNTGALALDCLMLLMAIPLVLFGSRILSMSLWLFDGNGLEKGTGFTHGRTAKMAAVVLAMLTITPGVLSMSQAQASDASKAALAAATSQTSLQSEIDSELAAGKPVFLLFYSESCHFCDEQKPIVDELEQEYGETVAFVRVDSEENTQAIDDFGLVGFPTMLLISGKGTDGEYLYQRITGYTDIETLRDTLGDLLAEWVQPTEGADSDSGKDPARDALEKSATDHTYFVNPEADSEIRDSSPTTPHGSSTQMGAGHDVDLGAMRSFVFFDLSDVPDNATLMSASFNAYVSSCPGTILVTLHRVTSPWSEGAVTWSEPPDIDEGAPAASEQVTYGSPGRWKSWDITDLVRDWLAGTPNYGLSLRGPEPGGYARFSTSESSYPPYLVVGYTLPETDPPLVSVSHSPDPATSEDLVTFDATASDEESGIQWIRIYVNGEMVEECLSSTCTHTTTEPYPEDSYVSYYASAQDGADSVGTSEIRGFSIGEPPDTTPPQVNVSHSPDPTTSEDLVTFDATASDEESGIQWIRIYVNGEMVEECPSSTCSHTTEDSYSVGQTVFYYAVARDSARVTGQTDPQQFLVGVPPDSTPPNVQVQIHPEIPTADDEVRFTATASDDSSGIQWITLSVNGVYTVCDSSPCIYDVGPYAAGTVVTYSAQAADRHGNFGDTDDQSFTVTEPAEPPTTPEVTIHYYRFYDYQRQQFSNIDPEITTEDMVVFVATASDPDGIEKIEITVNPPGPSVTVQECPGRSCMFFGGPYSEGVQYYGALAWDTENNSGSWYGRLDVKAPTCDDGIRNQGEEDVDCGGPCTACDYVAVRGRILFEDGNFVLKPFRLGKYRVRGGVNSDRKTTYSDGSFYALVRRKAGKEIHITIGGSSTGDFRAGFNRASKIARDLRDCNEYVWWTSYDVTIPETGDIDFGELTVGMDADQDFTGYWKEREGTFCGGSKQNLDGGSRYFSIADALLTAREYADGYRSPLESDSIGKATLVWPDKGCNGTSCYSPFWNEIWLVRNRGLMDGTVIHEYAHFLQRNISTSDWYAGDMSHEFCTDKNDTEFAWSEGFAEYFGTIVVVRNDSSQDSPNVRIDWIEEPDRICGDSGDTMESTVAGVLWDLVDDPTDPDFPIAGVTPFGRIISEDFDNVSGLEEEIFHVFDRELDNYVDAPDLYEFYVEGFTCPQKILQHESQLIFDMQEIFRHYMADNQNYNP